MLKLWLIFIFLSVTNCEERILDVKKTLIWGPGLKPDVVVLPARYFFIHAVDENGKKFDQATLQPFNVQITGKSPHGNCRSNINIIDRQDGSSIVRYKIAEWCDEVKIEIRYNGTHVAQSPYSVKDKVYSDSCYCPENLNVWLFNNECRSASEDEQMTWDLHSFKRVNFTAIRDNLIKRYNMPESVALCHYVVKNQEIWRTCYGKHTGFKMFMDATLNALSRVALLPDMEFFMNLGDRPLSKKGGQQRTSGPYPIFSWCGSDESYDITLPTYDITESTLQNMGSVMLDMLSVQKNEFPWETKTDMAFFRGRDSRRARLDLIKLSREYPKHINASLTNFFFFRDEEHIYGPKVPHISFMEFFRHKYQLNIDGVVAAYRFPYLLAGGSLVFKQTSHYYEHFYSKLTPFTHYVPIKRDLSDLIEKIEWARKYDTTAREISRAARDFAEQNLLPQSIYCYHLALFKEWSTRLISPVTVLPNMEKVKSTHKCTCPPKDHQLKDEL